MKLSKAIHQLQTIQQVCGDDPELVVQLPIEKCDSATDSVDVQGALEKVVVEKNAKTYVKDGKMMNARVILRAK